MIHLIKDNLLSSQYALRISLILQNLNWIIWYDEILTDPDCFDNNKVSVNLLSHEYQLHGFKINVRPNCIKIYPFSTINAFYFNHCFKHLYKIKILWHHTIALFSFWHELNMIITLIVHAFFIYFIYILINNIF